MNITLSTRVGRIKPSPTLALSSRANQLKAEGKDIINLTIGEPDFDTPEHIKEAARKALHDGLTKYTAVDGMPSLKKAVINKFARENKLNYEPAQIMVANGGKQALYNLMQVLLNPEDEVIIPAPYWVSYPDMVLLADGKPVFIPTSLEQHFKITAAQLEQAITPKTKLFILNSPSNPSGMVYNKSELTKLAEVLLRHPHVFVVTDDMYEHIYWGKEPFHNILNVCPELYDRTMVVNAVSKAYAMTGWRIGYAGGPKELIKAMTNIQSQSTSNPNSIAQAAALVALEGDQQCIRDMNKIYHQRYEIMFNGLNKIPGVKCPAVDGSFYSFPDMQHFIGKQLKDDYALADFLLNEAGIAGIPGSAFGTAGCMRFSFATSEENLHNALERLMNALYKIA